MYGITARIKYIRWYVIHVFIHSPSIIALIWTVDLAPSSKETLGMRWECKPDEMPVHHRAACTHVHTIFHTQGQLSVTRYFLRCGRKPKNPEEAYAHISRPQRNTSSVEYECHLKINISLVLPEYLIK